MIPILITPPSCVALLGLIQIDAKGDCVTVAYFQPRDFISEYQSITENLIYKFILIRYTGPLSHLPPSREGRFITTTYLKGHRQDQN